MREFTGIYEYIESRFENKWIADSLKYECEIRMHNYGDHLSAPYRFLNRRTSLRSLMRRFKPIRHARGQSVIVYKGYHLNANLEEDIRDAGYSIEAPVYEWPRGPFQKLKERIAGMSFSELASPACEGVVQQTYNELRNFYSSDRYTSLILPYDRPFWEKLILRVFRELGRKTTVFLHGLPGVYNLEDNWRGDNLVVWGPRIKENYGRIGGDVDRIRISGNPNCDNYQPRSLRAGLGNVLVTPLVPEVISIRKGSGILDRGGWGTAPGASLSVKTAVSTHGRRGFLRSGCFATRQKPRCIDFSHRPFLDHAI